MNNMIFFCIKYFINTKDIGEKCRAASALGRAKDPAALLVLVDIVNDDKAEDIVRESAREALEQMKQHYRKFRNVIDELLLAIERKDQQKLVEILISSFEKDGKRYLQSAYVIGHELMGLGQYEAAREWLLKAQIRNKKESIYQDQINDSISKCNDYLFAEGDELYKEGDYYAAKEHYTMAATRLKDEDKKRYAAHLRLACVYCKIGDYVDADQSLLQALQHHHETDNSLALIRLLQNVLTNNRKVKIENSEKSKIDKCVAQIMDKVTTEGPEKGGKIEVP